MPEFVTEREVLARLKMSSRTLRAWVSAGKFPEPARFGDDAQRARKRWLASDVDAWVEQQLAKRPKQHQVTA